MQHGRPDTLIAVESGYLARLFVTNGRGHRDPGRRLREVARRAQDHDPVQVHEPLLTGPGCRCRGGVNRLALNVIAEDAPDRAYSVLPRNLLAFTIGSSAVTDAYLVNTRPYR